jgi:YVTN family beta-propeller protein
VRLCVLIDLPEGKLQAMKVFARIAVVLGAIWTALSLPATLPAQSTSTTNSSLLVLSKHDHTLSVVDPVTLQVVARMPVGNDPHEVIASSDGRTAYVSNYGFGAYNTLAVLDLVARRALPSIDLGPLRGPHGLTFVGGKTWFTAEAAKAIGRYDPATDKVDWILGTGQNRTHMVYVSDDQQRIITTNVSSGTVSLIELEPVHMGPPPGGIRPPNSPTGAPGGPGGLPPGGPMPRKDWNETVIRVGNGSEGFDVSPDRGEVWVANAQDGTISIIDIATRKVVATLSANVHGANRLKFTPDGKRVLVSTLGGPDLVILDAATRSEIKRIPIGHGAAGIVMQPDGTRAFVACSPDNYVAVIDLQSLAVAGHIQAGGEPDGMAWAIRR